jgi:hypothetical protein
MTSLGGWLSILFCRRKTDIAISVGAGRCALKNNYLKTAQPTRAYPGPHLSARRSSGHRYSEPPEAGTVTSNLLYCGMQIRRGDLKIVSLLGVLFASWGCCGPYPPAPHATSHQHHALGVGRRRWALGCGVSVALVVLCGGAFPAC